MICFNKPSELNWTGCIVECFPFCSVIPLSHSNPQLLFFAKNNTKYTSEAGGGFLNHYFARITKFIDITLTDGIDDIFFLSSI